MKKEVNYQFKIIYAIGTLLILLGHTNGGGFEFTNAWFRSFLGIGLFAFASGYFYKAENEENIWKYLKKKFIHLIIPLIIWNIIYGLFVQFTKIFGFSIGKELSPYNLLVAPFTNGMQFGYNLCFWYITPLFAIEVFNVLFRKTIKTILRKLNNNYFYLIVYLAIGLAGIIMANNGLNKEFFLLFCRTTYLLPFFAAGMLYKSNLEKHDKLNNYVYFAIILIVQLVIIYKYKYSKAFTPSLCNDYTTNILIPFIISFNGILFFLRISKILEPKLKDNKLMNLIADNAWNIMAHQFIGFFIVKLAFGGLSLITNLFANFDWERFKSDIWYFYLPKDARQFYILYLIAGIFVPILIGKIINKTKELAKSKFKKEELSENT